MDKQLERIEEFAASLERANLTDEEQALILVGGTTGPITVENNCSCKNAIGIGCVPASSNNCQCG